MGHITAILHPTVFSTGSKDVSDKPWSICDVTW